MSDGNANAVTLTPASGTGMSTYTLPARTTLGTEDIDLTARTGWGALQKSVHDNGFNGATLKFDASLARNKTARLDAAGLELTYYVPTLRGQTTAAIAGNTVATVGGEPVVKALGNDTLLYIQGTTYAPLASLNLSLNNIAESVFRFGVIARSLTIFETGSFSYPGAVIELPDNSPGWGFGGTLVQLKVFVCPNSSTCSASPDKLALDLARAAVGPDRDTHPDRTAGQRPELEPSTMNEMTPGLVAGMCAVLGLAIGSFLNVVAHRVPRGESW